MKNKEKKEAIDYLTDLSAWVLGGAMFIYLGFRTFDFFTFTFRDEDIIFAFLGLFSTTIGAVIFALIYKRSFYYDRVANVWKSDEDRKMVAMVMMITCAVGELVIAVADMTIIADFKTGLFMMTEGDLKTTMWFTAGLAGLVGAAIAKIKLTPRHPRTDPIIDMSEFDTDNNGVLDRNEGGRNQQARQPVNQNALEIELASLRKENERLKSEAPKERGGQQ